MGLGVTTGLMTLSFLAAIDRIPLGTAVAIEFLGPLTVAALSGKNKKAAIWPLVAFVGVVLMTEPWTTNVDPVGVGFAALAGFFWGLYIVLTQQVGDQFTGVQGLALSTPIAAVVAGVVGGAPGFGEHHLARSGCRPTSWPSHPRTALCFRNAGFEADE